MNTKLFIYSENYYKKTLINKEYSFTPNIDFVKKKIIYV